MRSDPLHTHRIKTRYNIVVVPPFNKIMYVLKEEEQHRPK